MKHFLFCFGLTIVMIIHVLTVGLFIPLHEWILRKKKMENFDINEVLSGKKAVQIHAGGSITVSRIYVKGAERIVKVSLMQRMIILFTGFAVLRSDVSFELNDEKLNVIVKLILK